MEYFSFSRLKYSFFGNIGILFGSVQCLAFNLIILSVSSFFKFCINDAKRDKLILKGENRLPFTSFSNPISLHWRAKKVKRVWRREQLFNCAPRQDRWRLEFSFSLSLSTNSIMPRYRIDFAQSDGQLDGRKDRGFSRWVWCHCEGTIAKRERNSHVRSYSLTLGMW